MRPWRLPFRKKLPPCPPADAAQRAQPLLIEIPFGGRMVGTAVWMAAIVAACPGERALRSWTAGVWEDLPAHGRTASWGKEVSLRVARGEREAVWIVVQPGGPWVDLEVSVGALQGPGAAVIAPEAFRVLRGLTVRRPDGMFVADALVPIEVGRVRDLRHPETTNLPLLFDLAVPDAAPAGRYRGTITVSVGCERAIVPVEVVVADVAVGEGGTVEVPWPQRGEVPPGYAASAERARVALRKRGQATSNAGTPELALGAPTDGAWHVARTGRYDVGAVDLQAAHWGGAGAALWYPPLLDLPEGTIVESVRLIRLRDVLEVSESESEDYAASRDRLFEDAAPRAR